MFETIRRKGHSRARATRDAPPAPHAAAPTAMTAMHTLGSSVQQGLLTLLIHNNSMAPGTSSRWVWERRGLQDGGSIPPECPDACVSCQRDPVDFPVACTACCSSSNWCGDGAAWCNTGVDCSVCQPVVEGTPPSDEALSLGWLIIIFSSLAGAIYVGGGIYRGRQQNPDAPSLVAAHPHAVAWQAVPGLVSDGVHWTRVALGIASSASDSNGARDGEGEYQDLEGDAQEKGQLLEDGGPRRANSKGTYRKKRSRRKSDADGRGQRKNSRERSRRNTVAEAKPKPQPQPQPSPRQDELQWTVKERASVGERVEDLEIAVAVTSGAKE
jgi:hypothetical protein